jgi:hypothetical protein
VLPNNKQPRAIRIALHIGQAYHGATKTVTARAATGAMNHYVVRTRVAVPTLLQTIKFEHSFESSHVKPLATCSKPR